MVFEFLKNSFEGSYNVFLMSFQELLKDFLTKDNYHKKLQI